MSSFFTAPASQRKRKREDAIATPSSKKIITNKTATTKPQKSRNERDESISSSGSEYDSNRKSAHEDDALSLSSSEDEDEDETAAERRLRLAENYLASIKASVDETGFDAEEIDRDLIAERLKEDVAETKGRLYRHIASTLAFSKATQTQFRTSTLATTGVATAAPYVYTVTKDVTLTKWELSAPTPPSWKKPKKSPKPNRRRPTKLLSVKGDSHKSDDRGYMYHTGPILCVAASDTGKFIATGGADKRLIIYSASDLKPLRVFTQHRDAVTGLAFRRGTNQLYSCSKDRTLKVWSLDELAYVETLFGHQDEVVDVAALATERCVSVGARDRTARLWKVTEETQLVFRGGGSGEKKSRRKDQDREGEERKSYNEGSIDRVALISEDLFLTSSDNGSISLWTQHKKKPIFTVPLAHGLDPPMTPEEASAETDPDSKVPDPQPRWITALATIPYSDLALSGSWDGVVRVWKLSEDKKSLEAIGTVGTANMTKVVKATEADKRQKDIVEAEASKTSEPQDTTMQEVAETEGISDAIPRNGDPASSKPQAELQPPPLNGIINDLSVFTRPSGSSSYPDTLTIVAALGASPRLGRWHTIQNGKNGAVVFEVPLKQQKKKAKKRKKKERGQKEKSGDGAVLRQLKEKGPGGVVEGEKEERDKW